jgi:hypothetical protein
LLANASAAFLGPPAGAISAERINAPEPFVGLGIPNSGINHVLYQGWFGSSGFPNTSQPRMPLGVSCLPCCSTMRVFRLWHDVQQDITWSSGGYGSPPLLIGIMWSTATAMVNCPSFKQYSQSGFCCSFMRRKRCQRCVVYGHFAIPSPYQSCNVDHRRRPRRDADRHAGRDNRVYAASGFSLAQLSISGAVHFDSAIGRRHF